jgi:xanthine/CO dehydrogenase XdhC/CoxF family maturation factor
MPQTLRLLAALAAAPAGPLVLATVLRTQGPAYRRAGAMLLLDAEGRPLAGGVSAGCLEDDVSLRVADVLRDGRPARVTYDADGGSFGVSSGCGGRVEVLLEPVADAPSRDVARAWLDALARLDEPAALATVLHGRADGRGGYARAIATADDAWWFDHAGGESVHGDVRRAIVADAAAHLAPGSGAVRRYGEIDVAWAPAAPSPHLVIGGALPDAAPVARHAATLGWRVTVCDPREGRPLPLPPVATRVARPPSALAAIADGRRHAAALVMFHQEAFDREALAALVARPPGYVGVLGPRARTTALLAGTPLVESAAWPAWLHAPVGLAIGAEDAEEIALSIVAELVAWHRGADGGALSRRDGPLHAVVAAAAAAPPAPWGGA